MRTSCISPEECIPRGIRIIVRRTDVHERVVGYHRFGIAGGHVDICEALIVVSVEDDPFSMVLDVVVVPCLCVLRSDKKRWDREKRVMFCVKRVSRVIIFLSNGTSSHSTHLAA